MSRRDRIIFPGAVYHAMSRGNRKSIIVDDDDDRSAFMRTLDRVASDYQARVYTACLMNTHYHALLDTPLNNLSEFIRVLNTEYSKVFNRRHKCVGHTFEQRFNSIVVQREKYLRRVARYIAMNPVKAGLCREAANWPWSTHRATAGLEKAPDWLYLDWLRWAFHGNNLAEAQRLYLEYVRDPSGLTWSFDESSLSSLGTARFNKAVGAFVGQADHSPIPFECRRRERPSLVDVFAMEEPIRHSRDALIVVARQAHGYTVAEIAKFLRVAPSTVSRTLIRTRGQRQDSVAPDGSYWDIDSRFTA